MTYHARSHDLPGERNGFWKRASFLLVLLGLALWERDVLWLPPYEDQAVGLWAEADFLARSNFDYYQLRYGESHFISPESGARSYMISVLPTAAAVLLRLAPEPEVAFFIAHLGMLAFAAGIVLFLYELLRPALAPLPAILICGAVVTTPMFRAQIELLGMDIPMTFFALWAFTYFQREKYVAAAAIGMGAFLMKATGNLVTLGMGTYLAGCLILGRGRPEDRSRYWKGLLANMCAAMVQFGLIAWGDTSVGIRRSLVWPEVLQLPYAIYWCPDVVALFVMVALGSVWSLAASPSMTFHDRLRRASLEWVAWFVILGVLIASSTYIFIPRYFTIGVPLLWLLAGRLLSQKTRMGQSWLCSLGIACWIGFNLLNATGRYFPQIAWAAGNELRRDPGLHERSCPFTERSREYLDDLKANLKGMQELARQAGAHPVFLPQPFYFLVTKPNLGYVNQPLNAINATVFSDTVAKFRDLIGNQQPDEVIFVWSGRSRVTVPPPASASRILYDDHHSTPLVIYAVDTRNIGRTAAAIEQWYLKQTWPGDWLSTRALVRREFLEKTGREQQAAAEIQQAAQSDPFPRNDLLQLARTSDSSGNDPVGSSDGTSDGGERYRWIMELIASAANGDWANPEGASFDPATLPERVNAGWTHLLRNSPNEARLAIEQAAVASDPTERGLASLGLAALALQRGDLAAADDLLAQLEHGQNYLSARDLLRAEAALQRGEAAAAIALLQQQVAHHPESFWFQLGLAQALARAGELQAAHAAFAKAVDLRPNSFEARQGSALTKQDQPRG